MSGTWLLQMFNSNMVKVKDGRYIGYIPPMLKENNSVPSSCFCQFYANIQNGPISKLWTHFFRAIADRGPTSVNAVPYDVILLKL